MNTIPYSEHEASLPSRGKWLIGTGAETSLVVYQSLPRQVCLPAVKAQRFVPPFQFKRLSWIKPSFLWTMQRTCWGQLDDCILAIRVSRSGLFELLSQSVPSKFDATQFPRKRDWNKANKKADVLVQWDPDYDVAGKRIGRQAIQIGLRGTALVRYARELIHEITDISDFVRHQRYLRSRGKQQLVRVPAEHVFEVPAGIGNRLGLRSAPHCHPVPHTIHLS